MRSKRTEIGVVAFVVIGIIALITYDMGLTRISSYFLPNLTDPLPPEELAQYDKGKFAYYEEDYTTAYEFLFPLAVRGYAEAQHKIGYIYSDGPRNKRDLTKAQEWYLKAAKQNLAKSMYNLSYLMMTKQLSRVYPLQGLCWTLKSAEYKYYKAVLALDMLVQLNDLDDELMSAARQLSEKGECSNTPLL